MPYLNVQIPQLSAPHRPICCRCRCFPCLLSRLLKISGRLLQATSHHIDQGLSRAHSGDAHPFSPSPGVPSPSSGSRPRSPSGVGGRASSNVFYTNGRSANSQATAVGGNVLDEIKEGEGNTRRFRESLTQLPSPTRLDFANRFLEVRGWP